MRYIHSMFQPRMRRPEASVYARTRCGLPTVCGFEIGRPICLTLLPDFYALSATKAAKPSDQ